MSVIETGGVVLSLHRSRSSLAGWDYLSPDSGRSSFRGLIRRRAVSEAGRPDGRAIFANDSSVLLLAISPKTTKETTAKAWWLVGTMVEKQISPLRGPR